MIIGQSYRVHPRSLVALSVLTFFKLDFHFYTHPHSEIRVISSFIWPVSIVEDHVILNLHLPFPPTPTTLLTLILDHCVTISLVQCQIPTTKIYFFDKKKKWNLLIRSGNSHLHVKFVSCQLMSIRLYKSTLTLHVY